MTASTRRTRRADPQSDDDENPTPTPGQRRLDRQQKHRREVAARTEAHNVDAGDADGRVQRAHGPAGPLSTYKFFPACAPFREAYQLFVHSWMLVRFGPDEKAIRLYRECCEKTGENAPVEEFPRFIRGVNEYLGKLDFQLASGLTPDKGEKFWAMVNQTGDEIAQSATTLHPNELAYFKRLIDLIMRSDDETYEISSTGALRESSSVKPPLTKRAAEDLIHSFVRDGWLVNNAGYLSLSLRSVLELKSYLREEYDDQIRFCTLCKEIVTTHYQRCCLADCAGRLHLHCAKVYFESHPALCPVSSCHSPWRGESRRRLIAPERPIRPNRAASSIVDKLDDQDDQEDEEREKNSTPTGKGKGRPLESGSEPETGTEDVPLPSSSSGKRKRASRR